jgi:hypothetical protein
MWYTWSGQEHKYPKYIVLTRRGYEMYDLDHIDMEFSALSALCCPLVSACTITKVYFTLITSTVTTNTHLQHVIRLPVSA